MNVVLLCAGMSSRMGKTNKMLAEINNMTLIENSAFQALKYLEETNESSTLIIVTGYRHAAAERALKPCKDYVEHTKAPVKMIITYNRKYRQGQFTSVQNGVKQTDGNQNFFIALADMPDITAEHYAEVAEKLGNHDCVQMYCNNTPGHPVLVSSKMKKRILDADAKSKMLNILNRSNILKVQTDDFAFIHDIDTQQDLINAQGN